MLRSTLSRRALSSITSKQSVPLFARQCAVVSAISPSITNFSQHHAFHTSPVNSAKGKKSKKESSASGKKSNAKEAEEPETDSQGISDTININDISKRFQTVVDSFIKTANETKLGKSDPNLFNNLTVKTEDGDQPFTSLAQATIKGRKFFITVFDPSHAQDIVTAVLASDLNMNPQVDANNKQTLTVPLPPITTDTKKENVKVLKLELENYKAGNKTMSLNAVRTDIKQKIAKYTKKVKKLNDADNKVVNDFEKLHKTYLDKLAEVYKNAEQAIMK